MLMISDALSRLQALGLNKAFKPEIESETGAVLLRTRKTAQVIDGTLSGSEIFLCDSDFKIWTSQKRKAKTLASLHGLKVRLLDGEAELIVPAALADQLLPTLGAKVARTVSPEAAERSRAVLQRVRDAAKRSEAVKNSPNFESRPAQEGTSGDVPARTAAEQRPAALPQMAGSRLLPCSGGAV